MRAKLLGTVNPDTLGMERLPPGTFRYASYRSAMRMLGNTQSPEVRPVAFLGLVERMAEGLKDPRVTYRNVDLPPSGVLSNLDWHFDGQGNAEEVHRLFCLGDQPTMGMETGKTRLLHPGCIWEYPGNYLHKPLPGSGRRLLLRVSETQMVPRNVWLGIQPVIDK